MHRVIYLLNVNKNELSLVNVIMIALGGVIGAGIFVASGIPINIAGPGAVLAYIAGALVVIPIMLYTSEMAAAKPSSGGFSVYAHEYLGPMMGFVTGWMYWSSGILSMATEVTAAALVTHWWFPSWPLWIFSLIYSLLITILNFMDIRGFSKVEGLLAQIKVIALLLFIVLGLLFIKGWWPGVLATGTVNYFQWGGFLPGGWIGVYSSMLLVIFSYAGMAVIGMISTQVRNPGKTLWRAVMASGLTAMILYAGTILVITGIMPWQTVPTDSSPVVAVLQKLGVTFAGSLLNAIVLIAVLSCMNTSMFGVSRMLQSLAARNEAPHFLLKIDNKGRSIPAITITSSFLGLAILLAYVLPHKVFIYVASASGFIALFNWTITTLTYLRFKRHSPKIKQPFVLWGYPFLPYLSLFLLFLTVASIPLVTQQLPSMITGIVLVFLYSGIYMVFIKK
ncbi:MAG: GABA permease [Pelotomaculum sp. PtaB.Bin013]|uniref:Amino acid permease n=1 Tax=Pelotomaculum isophthalicicum JI TaxID=947010 RepID=A0A9X4GY26_9FIRM|nr:amino acid permease [Pelotomaculum isophthalicicum]MDF9407400.1 amino acid permease [Pelotomaculum isophthalicicum JI]OPX87429.1 MAG: GABA permease [Pelotomaculum sp. PtaB.Bin013]